MLKRILDFFRRKKSKKQEAEIPLQPAKNPETNPETKAETKAARPVRIRRQGL